MYIINFKWQNEKLINNAKGNIIPELRRHFRQSCVKEHDFIDFFSDPTSGFDTMIHAFFVFFCKYVLLFSFMTMLLYE